MAVKLAVIDLFESIWTDVVADVPEASSVQLLKLYPARAVAVTEASVPASYG
ncbi:hypothetical protein ES703_61296 [subsurface metagenome]